MVAQRHKLALQRDVYVKLLGNQNLVNRRIFYRKFGDYQLKVTPGMNSEKRVVVPVKTAYNGEPLMYVLFSREYRGKSEEVCPCS